MDVFEAFTIFNSMDINKEPILTQYQTIILTTLRIISEIMT